MKELPVGLYLVSAVGALLLSLGLTPAVRAAALRLGVVDRPHGIKDHERPTPVVGGVAIWLAFAATLVAMRFFTDFPTGTLKSLRALLVGGSVLFFVGLTDDVQKPVGLSVPTKFLFQIAAALLLLSFDIRIHFLQPPAFAGLISVIWIVGVTNALNLVDIMDGLAASQAAIAAAGFLLIALPSKEIYVSFAAAALMGACLGFLPWNFSSKRKIFMGDGGALSVGFVLAAVSMGTHYSAVNPLGVYAPLLILALPILDTLFVMGLRMGRGHNPFKGSRDHFALRLESLGWSRKRVVAVSAAAAAAMSSCAWLVTRLPTQHALAVYTALGLAIFTGALMLSQVHAGERRP